MPWSLRGTGALALQLFPLWSSAISKRTGENRVSRGLMQPFPIRDALVVDADSDVKDVLVKVLKPGIWAIQHVPTNQAALQAAQGKAFELIITSERTSGDEDVKLLGEIRLRRPHTRLIILASESTPADVLASMRAHAFSFFSKPYSLEQLGNMIQLATEAPCWDDGIELESSTLEWIKLQVPGKNRRSPASIHERNLRFARRGAGTGRHGIPRDLAQRDGAWRASRS